MITQRLLKELLSYNEKTGVFIWLKSRNNVVTGKVAGHVGRNGYVDIRINNVRYYAHRLAWMYMTGEAPKNVIDHIDRCKTNNAFCNLRDVSIKQNTANQIRAQANSSTGVRGVHPYVNGYTAHIGVDGRSRYLGVFKTIESAKAAYLTAKEKLSPLPRRRPE